MEAATATTERGQVAIAKGKKRKTITLPEELIARVRAFRFRGQYEEESDAYVALILAGLAALGAEAESEPPAAPAAPRGRGGDRGK